VLRRKISCSSIDLIFEEGNSQKVKDGEKVSYGGIITDKKVKYTRNNKVMAFVKLEDMYGSVEVVVFPNSYERYQQILIEDNIIIVEGRAQITEGEESNIVAEKIMTLTDSRNEVKNSTLFLKIDTIEYLDQVISILNQFKGNIPVKIRNADTGELLGVPRNNWVNGDEELIGKLMLLLGEKSVVLRN